MKIELLDNDYEKILSDMAKQLSAKLDARQIQRDIIERSVSVIESEYAKLSEKEIPKQLFYEDLDFVWCCPTCLHRIDNYYRINVGLTNDGRDPYKPMYCPECGQHLDWAKSE